MKLLRSIVIGAVLWVAATGAAFAQCGTSAPANKFCGNDTGAQQLAGWKSVPTGALTPIPGGTLIGNNTGSTAVPSATTAPVLGIPGTSTGQIGLAGSGSGTATLKAQTAAGSAISLLPTAAGTLVGTAASPLSINPVTGQISITGQAGGVLAGAGPAFTQTPVLGVPNSAQGSLGFAGASGGTATVTAQATAGTPTLTLPNTSGTLADGASSPLVLSATTGNLTCPTCVTSSGGGAITGVAPIAVSAAGAVSINAPYTTLTANNGGIVYSGATNLAILNGTATARQMLQSGATAAPAWSTATWPATTAAGSLLVSATANTVTATPTPTLGVASSTLGTLTFANLTSGGITISPPAGALGAVTNTLQAVTDTFVYKATTDTLTNKTLTSPTINAGALSGTFTGAPTLSGNLTLSGVPILSGLSAGTCSSGIAIDASNNAIKASCPGSATSVTVGTTTVTGATVGLLGFSTNGGVLQSFPRTAQYVCDIISSSAITCNNGGVAGANNGTFTPPAGLLYLEIELTGAGGGGGGSATSSTAGGAGGNTCWNTTGAACTSPVYQAAGGGGGAAGNGGSSAAGGAGGTCSGSSTPFLSVPGATGQSTVSNTTLTTNGGGFGGGSPFLGGGAMTSTAAGTTNSGGGAAGGGVTGSGGAPGAGGGGGAGCKAIISGALASTYTYAVGIAGSAGAGASGNPGGAGATGHMTIRGYYN